mgnify:CR=1 FL=1
MVRKLGRGGTLPCLILGRSKYLKLLNDSEKFLNLTTKKQSDKPVILLTNISPQLYKEFFLAIPESKNVFLKVINVNNKFCLNYKKKDIIELPIAHNEGNYFANDQLLKNLEDQNLIAFKYCDYEGKVIREANPNGSSKNIAGILNNQKNILGMMPHPERMIDAYLSGEDGSIFIENLVNNLKQ